MKPQDIDAIGVVVVGNLADLAAERAVLAGICRYGSDGYVEVSDIVDIDTFTIDSNQMLFKCLQKTLKDESKKLIDLPTILSSASELGLSEHFTKPDEIKHLRGITNLQVDFSNIRKFAGKIKKLHIARLYYHNLDLAKTDIASIRGDETVDEIVSLAENRILDLATVLNTGTGNQIKLMGQDGEEYLQYLIDNPRECIGIPTPFKRFNEAIGGGLRRQAIDVIAARFKKGKSFLGDNTAIYISGELNIPVLNVDTEMSHHQHLHRIWANMSGVETKKIETGKMSPVEIKKVKDAQKKLRVMPYSYLCVKGMVFEEVLSLMRRWVVQHVGKDENGNTKDAVLIYDYIKLLDSSTIKNNFSEHQAVGYLMTSLVNFVGKHDISCLSFVQLNRDGITKESTDIISLSDRIGWFCGSLSLYKDKEPEEIGEDGIENGNKKLVNLATRFGEGMHFDDYINMNFRGSIGRITEGLTKFELIKEKKGAVTANCDNDIAF